MVDIALIQGTISSINIAKDIAKGMLDLKVSTEVVGKVAQIQDALISAQLKALEANAAQAAIIEEVRTLKEEIARMKTWDSEKQRYKLAEPWKGSLAYGMKQSMSNMEPPHYICTSCYENGRKSILNQKEDAKGFTFYACPVCKSQIPTGYCGTVGADYAPE